MNTLIIQFLNTITSKIDPSNLLKLSRSLLYDSSQGFYLKEELSINLLQHLLFTTFKYVSKEENSDFASKSLIQVIKSSLFSTLTIKSDFNIYLQNLKMLLPSDSVPIFDIINDPYITKPEQYRLINLYLEVVRSALRRFYSADVAEAFMNIHEFIYEEMM